MAKTDNRGIDYSMGLANRDPETGVHYGICSVHRLVDWFWDEAEPVYFHGCGHCGEEFDEDFETPAPCPTCGEDIDEDEDYGDEPMYHKVDSAGVVGTVDQYNDLSIVKSPVAIHAQYCSPCAPGAGHIENPCKEGPLTYALPLDWFGEGEAPYSEEDIQCL